jgi:lipopolysaccharide transport system permease protein
MKDKITVVTAPKHGLSFPNLAELWEYREMLALWVWRDVKVRYIQSALGIGWAVFPALSQMVIYTLIFGQLVRIDSDGAPYALFALTGVIPWVYFSQSINNVASSIYGAGSFLQKIYFPRVILPISAILDRGFDFAISLIVLFVILAVSGASANYNVLFLPLLILILMMTSLGYGMLVAAVVVHFRDLLHMMGYVTTFLMYCSPVVYPVSLVPEHLRLIYALNPMVGVIEGFRAALLSTRPMPWDLIAIGGAVALVGLLVGGLYFARTEHKFADVA